MIGLGIGAALGIGFAAYTDYQDDCAINGSIGWQKYLGYGVIGGAIGAGIGFGVGYWKSALASFLKSSFSFSFGTLDLGGALILDSVTLTGAQLVGGAVAAGIGIMLFSKGFGPRMGHNQHEKQMWNEAMNQLDINDKDLIRRLHDEVHKYPYQDKLKGLLKVLREILTNWGKL